MCWGGGGGGGRGTVLKQYHFCADVKVEHGVGWNVNLRAAHMVLSCSK